MSTSYYSARTENIILEVLDEDYTSILEEKDVVLEDQKEVNAISIMKSIEDRENTALVVVA